MNYLVDFPLYAYFKQVVSRTLFVTIIAVFLSLLIQPFFLDGILSKLAFIVVAILVTMITIGIIGFSSNDRHVVFMYFIHKIRS